MTPGQRDDNLTTASIASKDDHHAMASATDKKHAPGDHVSQENGPPTRPIGGQEAHDDVNAVSDPMTRSSDQELRMHQQSSHRKKSSPKNQPHMGHYPPRPESRQESPPTSLVVDSKLAPSALSESWNDISNQFEESVGKPSREAVHKFFYPAGNHHNKDPKSPSQTSPNKRRIGKATVSSRDEESLQVKPQITRSRQTQRDSSHTSAVTTEPRNQEQSSLSPPSAIISSEPPISNNSSSNNSINNTLENGVQEIEENQQRQEIHSIQQQSLNTTMSGNSSAPGNGEWSRSAHASAFQRSFVEEEEQDRKYVERFWTTYDDLVILSLFTQIGVVARLAASTWFTFFDGVFRADSALFTVLPLNCLSCFLLGILGSGDRLMEVITTRFTPRSLQQSIVDHHGAKDVQNSGYEQDYCCDNSENVTNQHVSEDGLRRRRRPTRKAKRSKPFHSWEPPIHWHDDLREVQLLALERRIRASKCLLLFPVAKEDADVMEHYFGEGYKATADRQQRRPLPPQQKRQEPHEQQRTQNSRHRRRRRRHRRRFGRQTYSPTRLTDSDLSDPRSQERLGCDNDDDSDCDDDDFGLNGYRSGEEADKDDEYDDGLFRFDLELTESTEMAAEQPAEKDVPSNGVKSPSSAGSLTPSVQKLIKRSPGLRSASSPRHIDSPRTTSHQPPQAKPAFNPLHGGLGPRQDQPPTCQKEDYPLEVTLDAGDSSLLPSPERCASPLATPTVSPESPMSSTAVASGGEASDPHIEQIISNVQANVSENISRLGRVNLADGWDVGTTPEAMADDLMLGLRDGFCGALSSFSSWNSSMLNLLRQGHVGEAVVGYMLGIQLPIVAYRFGQQSAVFFFVWRCRREARREARKGWYGIRVKMDGSDDDSDNSGRRENLNSLAESRSTDEVGDDLSRANSAETIQDENVFSREVPSVRAICTALYLLALVTQLTSFSFYGTPEYQQISLSLLFSPIGTLARWRLSKLNCWRPGFPVGTFACNILACAINGSLGSMLAGNPGPKERIFLQGLIAGFGVSLSSLATFIVEILAGMDPLLFRFDGLIYAVCSIAWALIVGFIFSASADFADETT